MKKKNLLIIIFSTFVIRLFLAYAFYGSYDVDNAYHFSQVALSGQNVYEQTSFNYTPIWLYLLLFANLVEKITSLPFYFLIKIYPIFADTIVSLLLFVIARKIFRWSNSKSLLLALLYALSPISILITSFHGQFDSIPLSLILASYYFLSIKKPRTILTIVFLSLSIAFKIWPIILLPLFAILVNGKLVKKLLFMVASLIMAFLPLLPSFLFSPQAVIHNVFFYFGTGDFGLPVFFEFFQKNNVEPLSTLSLIIESHNFILARFILLLTLLVSFLIILKKKLPFFEAITFLILSFYTFSSRVSAQYLLWIIPFALLTKQLRFQYFYTVTATLALLASYQGHHSTALTPAPGFEFLTIPNLHLPFGITMFLWWLTCAVWWIKLLDISICHKKLKK